MITITLKLAGLAAASAVALVAPSASAAGPHHGPKGHPKTTKAPSKSSKAAAWSFPPCSDTVAEYDYIYSGDPCTSTHQSATKPTNALVIPIESSAEPTSPVDQQKTAFCNGSPEYEYVYSGCRS